MFHDRECSRCQKAVPHRIIFIEDRSSSERQWFPAWRCTVCALQEQTVFRKIEFVLIGGSYDGESIEATYGRLTQTAGGRAGMTLTLPAKGNPHTTEIYQIRGFPSVIDGGIIVRAEFMR